jgi:hypothetical protein
MLKDIGGASSCRQLTGLVTTENDCSAATLYAQAALFRNNTNIRVTGTTMQVIDVCVMDTKVCGTDNTDFL